MINYELAILLGICAYVYTNWLTEPNMILHGTYTRLYKFFNTEKRIENDKPVHWLFMLLIYCEKCVAGQWALWVYLYMKWHFYIHDFTIMLVICHILFILTTIFVAGATKFIINKIANE